MNGCILLHPNQIIKRIKRAYREIDLVIIYDKDFFFQLSEKYRLETVYKVTVMLVTTNGDVINDQF